MTNNEMELIRLIRENDDSGQACQVAIDIILSFLTPPESSQSQDLAYQQELG